MQRHFPNAEMSSEMKAFQELREFHEILNQLERIPDSNVKKALVSQLEEKLSNPSINHVTTPSALWHDLDQKDKECHSLQTRIKELEKELQNNSYSSSEVDVGDLEPVRKNRNRLLLVIAVVVGFVLARLFTS